MKLGMIYFAFSNHWNKIRCRCSCKLTCCYILCVCELSACALPLKALTPYAKWRFISVFWSIENVHVSKGCSGSILLAEFERKFGAYSDSIISKRL